MWHIADAARKAPYLLYVHELMHFTRLLPQKISTQKIALRI